MSAAPPGPRPQPCLGCGVPPLGDETTCRVCHGPLPPAPAAVPAPSPGRQSLVRALAVLVLLAGVLAASAWVTREGRWGDALRAAQDAGRAGWDLARSRFQDLREPAASFEVKPTVGSLFVRSTPDTQNAPVAVLHAGDVVRALDVPRGGWMRVRLGDGREGYVAWEHVRARR